MVMATGTRAPLETLLSALPWSWRQGPWLLSRRTDAARKRSDSDDVVEGADVEDSERSESSELEAQLFMELEMMAEWARVASDKIANENFGTASTGKREPKRFGLAGLVFNLIKNIVGAGVLSLPAGLAAIGGEPSLLLPAMILVVTMGILSAYTFFSIGRQCCIHDVSTYTQACEKSIGKRSRWAAMVATYSYIVLGCTTYSIIVGDTFSALAKSGVLGSVVESSSLAKDRRTWIVGVSAAVLYPLCCLKSLGALAFTSVLGTVAAGYTVIFMSLRYVDGSYLPDGCFHTEISVLPSWGTDDGKFLSSFRSFVSRSEVFALIAICSKAFNAHTNAPLYAQGVDRDIAKLGLVTVLGFGFATLINLVFLSSGFLTFGSASAGVILNNYARTDRLATLARALFGTSIALTYPVLFAGLKPLLKSLLSRFARVKDDALLNHSITLFPIVAITAAAVLISDAAIINTISGAFCGAMLIYILPSLMSLKGSLPTGKACKDKVGNASVKTHIEKMGNIGLIVFGIFLIPLGISESLKGNF